MENVFYLALGTFIDFFLSLLFPADFALKHPLFFSCCGLFALINNCRDLPLVDSIKQSVVYGLIVSLFYPYTFWMHAILYTVLVLLLHLWLISLNDSFFGMALIELLLLFVFTCAMYVFLRLKHLIAFSFALWAYRVILPCIAGNLPGMFVMLGLDRWKRSVQARGEEIKEKKERVFLYDLFNRKQNREQ